VRKKETLREINDKEKTARGTVKEATAGRVPYDGLHEETEIRTGYKR